MAIEVNDVVRKNFQATGDSSVGDSIDVTFRTDRYRDGEVSKLSIQIENPWAGDTESGFGRDSHIDMSVADAIHLARFILAVTGESP